MKKILSFLISTVLVLSSFSFSFADTAYIVKSGDTLAKIAHKYGITYQELGKYNHLKNLNFLKVNQKLMIPSKTTATSGTTAAASGTNTDVGLPEKGSTMVLASTTSTQDTGFFDVLIPAFEKKYGVKTKVIAVGSGEAMAIGQRGDADVLLVHSRAAEDKFIADGFGINRKDVMHNYFIIVGPKGDPAKIRNNASAADAFKLIYDTDSTFLSRADKSGTNTKELAIWKKASVAPAAATDKWYLETGKGMGDTLTMANELKGYTIVDSGTWGSMMDKLDNLVVMVQGDTTLYNPYGVIAVNPAKFNNVNYKAAMAFINYITSPEGQDLIKNYKTKTGQYIFIPDAKQK